MHSGNKISLRLHFNKEIKEKVLLYFLNLKNTLLSNRRISPEKQEEIMFGLTLDH
jgi:hypothetical protein